MVSINPLQYEALGDRVADSLRQLIVENEIAAGTRLTEEDLASQFGVSRGPIRDALRMLAAEGLVKPQRRGSLVIGLTVNDVDELYSIRSAVENLAVMRCIERADDDGLEGINASISAMRKAAASDDHEKFAAADRDFHNFYLDLSEHRRLGDVWATYAPSVNALLARTVRSDLDLDRSAHDHQVLADLIHSRNEDAALTELHAHIARSRDRVLRSLDDAPADASLDDVAVATSRDIGTATP